MMRLTIPSYLTHAPIQKHCKLKKDPIAVVTDRYDWACKELGKRLINKAVKHLILKG